MPRHFASERVNAEHAYPVWVLEPTLHLLDQFYILIMKNELSTGVDWVSVSHVITQTRDQIF